MYAVIESGGKQYRVAPGDVIRVEKLDVQTGDSIHLDRVLLVAGDSGVQVGQPTLANTRVTATVKAHGRGEKIRVFKRRRRKNFRKTIGHRQDFTEIEITGIGG